MDSKLQLFAKVLLKEHYDEFLEMIQLFNIYTIAGYSLVA